LFQENSQSEEESEELDEEDDDAEEIANEQECESETPQTPTDNVDNSATLKLPSRRSSRVFDGLSVIDEQTEETQTTDGHGTSRASSAHPDKVFGDDRAHHPPQNFFGEVDTMFYPYPDCRNTSRRPSAFGDTLETEWPGYVGIRPPSPYPYGRANTMPTYTQRLLNLQEPNIPMQEGNPWLEPSGENPSWLDQDFFGNTPKYPDGRTIEEFPLGLTEKSGPDVFMTDSYPFFTPPPMDLMDVASDLVSICTTSMDLVKISLYKYAYLSRLGTKGQPLYRLQ